MLLNAGPPYPTPTASRINLEHIRLQGNLKPTTAILNGVAVSQLIPIAGCPAGRVYWKSSCAGSLKLELMDPTGTTAYASSLIGPTAILAGTENHVDFNPRGEAYLLITFTPSADGTITFCDACGL